MDIWGGGGSSQNWTIFGGHFYTFKGFSKGQGTDLEDFFFFFFFFGGGGGGGVKFQIFFGYV